MPIPPRRFGKRAPVGADSAASNPAHISLDWAGLAPRRAPAATPAASRRRRNPRPACTDSAITKNTAPTARRRGGGPKYGAVELHQRIVLHAPGGPAARDRRPPAAFGGHLRAARTAASGFDREAAVPACRPPHHHHPPVLHRRGGGGVGHSAATSSGEASPRLSAGETAARRRPRSHTPPAVLVPLPENFSFQKHCSRSPCPGPSAAEGWRNPIPLCSRP